MIMLYTNYSAVLTSILCIDVTKKPKSYFEFELKDIKPKSSIDFLLHDNVTRHSLITK